MVKFKKLWLFERSEFQRFLNFITAQFIAEIRPDSEIIYMNIYRFTSLNIMRVKWLVMEVFTELSVEILV